MSQLIFKNFIKNNKHLLILQPTLALALLVAAHQTFAEDLFTSEPNPQQPLPAQEMINQPTEEDDTVEPLISPTDAALRAQQHVDGKVMNVRKFSGGGNRTLYGVKVLQKNGRIKTVTVDADSGAILE